MGVPGSSSAPAEAGHVPRPEGRGLAVSVVFPCLNEEGSVGLCVRQASSSLSLAGMQGEVVVVDNGSTDGSAAMARDHEARVVPEPRRGYGSALMAGIASAAGNVVVMADADATYDLGRIPDLARPVLEGRADLVIGTRKATGRRAMPLLHRLLGTPILTFLIARATGGRRVTDSQSGFRAFRREDGLALGLRSTGMEFASEMVVMAARAGWRIQEVSTGYRQRIGESKLRPLGDGWRHIRLMALLAPDLLLVWPGAAALLAGLTLSIWSLFDPGGIQVGSIRWQPIFFSTIAMVFGAQALLAGSVIAYVSSVSPGSTTRAFSFVGDQRFLSWCGWGGLSAAAAGLLIDLVLFVMWTSGYPPWDRALPLAALAQGLVITGTTVSSFALITRLLVSRAEARGSAARSLAALIAGRSSDVDETGAGAHGSHGTAA